MCRIIYLARRSFALFHQTHMHTISFVTWRWGSSCSALCSRILPPEYVLSVRCKSGTLKTSFFITNNKAVHQEEELWLFQLFWRSIIHSDRCQKRSMFILAALWQQAAKYTSEHIRSLNILNSVNSVLCMTTSLVRNCSSEMTKLWLQIEMNHRLFAVTKEGRPTPL